MGVKAENGITSPSSPFASLKALSLKTKQQELLICIFALILIYILAVGASKYDFFVVSHGDDISLDTDIDTSRIASTVLNDTPICVLTVDNVLPSELFGSASEPALGPIVLMPSLAPAPAPTLVPIKKAPSPSPKTKAPSPRPPSPSAPPRPLRGCRRWDLRSLPR